MPQDNTRAVLEALLFVSERPLTLEQIKNALDNLDTTQIRTLVSELMSEYELNNRGMRIIEVAGGFQMITASGLATFVKKMFKQRKADKLSRPALETLAIVAYKQPVTRLEIESIRNVNIDGMVKTLLDKGLIRVAGIKKAPGRPKVYGTTRQFLEYFGLKSLDELPKIESLPTVIEKKEGTNETQELTSTN